MSIVLHAMLFAGLFWSWQHSHSQIFSIVPVKPVVSAYVATRVAAQGQVKQISRWHSLSRVNTHQAFQQNNKKGGENASSASSLIAHPLAAAVLQKLLHQLAALIGRQLPTIHTGKPETVLLAFTLLPSGKIRHLRIAHSSGDAKLDQAAQNAVGSLSHSALLSLAKVLTKPIEIEAPILFR